MQTIDEVLTLLKDGKERLDSDPLDGFSMRSAEYTLHYGLAVPLHSAIEDYVKGSLREQSGKLHFQCCLLASNLNVPEELNYALVWVNIGYREGNVPQKFLDELFEGIDEVAKQYPST